MKFATTKISLSIAALSAVLTVSPVAADNQAARTENPQTPAPTRQGIDYSDRAQMKGWSNEKLQLERELQLGQDKAFYVKRLAERGFHVTSVNTDKADAAEYEVVKGNQTYELSLDFDKAGKATKVDVTTNLWRSDATKAAMQGQSVPVATRFERGNETYSDRSHMQPWADEKQRLEKALAPGRDLGHYRQQLSSMGYQVTSVNDKERNYVEYEIVKGTNTYEVQIDVGNGRAEKVDVTTNAWHSEATERALSGARR